MLFGFKNPSPSWLGHSKVPRKTLGCLVNTLQPLGAGWWGPMKVQTRGNWHGTNKKEIYISLQKNAVQWIANKKIKRSKQTKNNKQTNKQTSKQASKQASKQTNKQTNSVDHATHHTGLMAVWNFQKTPELTLIQHYPMGCINLYCNFVIQIIDSSTNPRRETCIQSISISLPSCILNAKAASCGAVPLPEPVSLVGAPRRKPSGTTSASSTGARVQIHKKARQPCSVCPQFSQCMTIHLFHSIISAAAIHIKFKKLIHYMIYN